jgi:hypothetical protein
MNQMDTDFLMRQRDFKIRIIREIRVPFFFPIQRGRA